ncbi:MAG TPA: hypothetical protein PKN11_09485 [Anaerolineaceae bacterium]|nr:hypothetical protein [Anaerolineaceae bacterium]
MSEKLYLIRVNLERFLGPMPLKEVKARYKRMEFGLQDEVASSNKSWVTFDDFERIRRIYPELSDIVRKEMLGAWSDASLTPVQIVPGARTSTRGRGFAAGLMGKLFLVMLMVIVALFAYNMARNEEFSSRLFRLKDPNILRAEEYLGNAHNARHEAYLDRYMKDILPMIRKKKAFDEWMPHLRVVAFHRDGRIEGLRSTYLRGKKALPGPKDCSVAAWKTRWKRSMPQWELFVDGRLLNSSDWSRLLVWDPDWISRRSPAEGWVDPGSYFEACLEMALKAIVSLDKESLEGQDELREILASRIKWQLKMIRGETVGQEYSMSGSLWALSCIEGSERLESLDECQKDIDMSADWRTLLRSRTALAQFRILTALEDPLSAESMSILQKTMETIAPRDFITRFDYQAEIRFYQKVLSGGDSLSKAVRLNQDKSVDVRFD